MINITGNNCPCCPKTNLSWNLNYDKTEVEMFKCGHGTCKKCYKEMCEESVCFSCPVCNEGEQLYNMRFLTSSVLKWTTFADWYTDYDSYIKSGLAKNVVKNSTFGKQLLRLARVARESRMS